MDRTGHQDMLLKDIIKDMYYLLGKFVKDRIDRLRGLFGRLGMGGCRECMCLGIGTGLWIKGGRMGCRCLRIGRNCLCRLCSWSLRLNIIDKVIGIVHM